MAIRGANALRSLSRFSTSVPRSAVFSRAYSTPTDANKQIDPKVKAQSLLDALPGNSIVSKTGIVTLGVGLTTIAISKELYVLNEETLVLIAFSSMIGYMYKSLKGTIAEWVQDNTERIRSVLQKARDDHTCLVQERIDAISPLKDSVEVTKALFEMSKEMAKLEAEIYELKQKNAFAAEMKSALDTWVRYETSVREKQQKMLAAHVHQEVQAKLSDPKIQTALLQEALLSVEKLASVQQ